MDRDAGAIRLRPEAAKTGRVLFMYTPAAAGGYVEELLNHRPINDDERNQLRDRYHWEG